MTFEQKEQCVYGQMPGRFVIGSPTLITTYNNRICNLEA